MFINEEKLRYEELKPKASWLTNAARVEGVYKGKARPFCIPVEEASQNLFKGARQPALDYFRRNDIKWHDGKAGNPSNHLCDSQVCCVNFLFPFALNPNALVSLLRPLFLDVERVVPMEDGPEVVSFEWIGAENYLGERRGERGRTRGANFTSADAAVMYEDQVGSRHIVLIEWKYTEHYSPTALAISDRGTDRTAIYKHLWDKDDCPIRRELVPDFKDLFYEPFYQLMRQQFLANEMERAGELGATLPVDVLLFSSRALHRSESF